MPTAAQKELGCEAVLVRAAVAGAAWEQAVVAAVAATCVALDIRAVLSSVACSTLEYPPPVDISAETSTAFAERCTR